MSGWVQAIGTIVAIGSAAWIAGEQTRRERAKILRDQRIVVLIVLDIAQRACTQVGKFRQRNILPGAYVMKREGHAEGLESIESLYLELKGIDLTTVGNSHIVTALLRLRGACSEFLERIRSNDERSFTRLIMSSRNESIPAANKIHDAALELIDACAHPVEVE